jgi:hypothetical protein
VVEGWFEAPVTAEYHFIVKADVASTLSWSGNSSALLLETLASMDPTSAQAALAPVTVELWSLPSWSCNTPPCRNDAHLNGSLGAPLHTLRVHSVTADSLGGSGGEIPQRVKVNEELFLDTDFASRWTGAFRASVSGDCAFTLSVGGSAELMVDGAVVASSKHTPNSRIPCRLSTGYHKSTVSGCCDGGCGSFATLDAALAEAERRNTWAADLKCTSILYRVAQNDYQVRRSTELESAANEVVYLVGQTLVPCHNIVSCPPHSASARHPCLLRPRT